MVPLIQLFLPGAGSQVFECLLFALSVDKPEDARSYLIEKVHELRERGLVHWDMLIPIERRPPVPSRPYWMNRFVPAHASRQIAT